MHPISGIVKGPQSGTVKFGKKLHCHFVQQEMVAMIPTPLLGAGFESVGHGSPPLFSRLKMVAFFQFGIRLPDKVPAQRRVVVWVGQFSSHFGTGC
jgi:hypothetical protein